jgi:hypothetical protein
MSKRIKKISRKGEEQLAKDVGGRRHTGSGSQWHTKSDVSDLDFQYEDKFTENRWFKYTLSLASLQKIEKEARKVGKIPAFRFRFIHKGIPLGEFIVLRAKDCVFYPEMYPSKDGKKSMTLNLENLRTFYTTKIITLVLNFGSSSYVLFRYDDFLNTRAKILKGEEIL